jgi:hypothetical protein
VRKQTPRPRSYPFVPPDNAVAAADPAAQPGVPGGGSRSHSPSNGRDPPGRRHLGMERRGGLDRRKALWAAIVVASVVIGGVVLAGGGGATTPVLAAAHELAPGATVKAWISQW